MKDSFVFYKSWQKSLNRLPDGESFKKVFNALCDFVFDKKEIDETDFSDKELIIIDLTIPLLVASIANYENGKTGGRPSKINAEKAFEMKTKGYTSSQIADFFGTTKRAIEIFFQERKNEKTPEKTPKKPNDNDNANLNDTVNLKDNDTVNLKENEKDKDKDDNEHYHYHSSIPTLEKIIAFCDSKNLGVNPQEFFDYYEKRNWEKVSNWQRTLMYWNKRQTENLWEKSDTTKKGKKPDWKENLGEYSSLV